MKHACLLMVLLPACSRSPRAADDIEAACRTAFEALKTDDFGRILALVATDDDLKWIRTHGSSPFPNGDSERPAASDLIGSPGGETYERSWIRDDFESARMRGREYLPQVPERHPPTARDWASAIFDGLVVKNSVHAPVEVAEVRFFVRVNEETQHVFEAIVVKVNRGWIILELRCILVKRTGVAARLAEIYAEMKLKIDRLVLDRRFEGETPLPEMSEFGSDPWGRGFRLEVVDQRSRGRFRIWSDGPDRTPGTGDDRCVPPPDFVWWEPSVMVGR